MKKHIIVDTEKETTVNQKNGQPVFFDLKTDAMEYAKHYFGIKEIIAESFTIFIIIEVNI